jgi:hypothetical protein
MSNIFSPPLPFIGSVGFVPDFRMAAFVDSYDTIAAPGYLNNTDISGIPPLTNNSVIMAFYSYNVQTGGSIYNFDFFGVSIDGNGIITLQGW